MRTTGRYGTVTRYDVLPEYARLAAERRFSISIGRTYPLDKRRDTVGLSLSGKAKGKLVLLPGHARTS